MPHTKNQRDISPNFEEDYKEPNLYKVILHNDDYTTMEFVINILMEVFRKSLDEAEQLTVTVHKKQKAVVGIYTKEIAEVKTDRTIKKARSVGFPLLCTFEPVD